MQSSSRYFTLKKQSCFIDTTRGHLPVLLQPGFNSHVIQWQGDYTDTKPWFTLQAALWVFLTAISLKLRCSTSLQKLLSRQEKSFLVQVNIIEFAITIKSSSHKNGFAFFLFTSAEKMTWGQPVQNLYINSVAGFLYT